MSNEVAIPDYLKSMMDSGQVQSPNNLISQGSSVPRISLKGQKFRFIQDGEEIKKTGDPIHVVILGVQPQQGMCKTFYKDGYTTGEDSGPPDCSSSNGVTPDTWISSPVSSTCAGCPNNAWGSAESMSGGKAKACRDSKRLFVIPLEKGGDLSEADGFILNVTVASLKSLSEYGKHLVSNGVPMEAVITTVSLDDDSDFPLLRFKMSGILNEEMGMKSINRANKKEWAEIENKPEPAQQAEGVEHKPEPKAEAKPITIEGSAETESKPADAGSPAQAESVDDILDKWT